MNLRKRFGERIKYLRTYRGLKQSELAELVGIANKTQSCIETGKNFPSVEVIEKYTKALDVKLEDILDLSFSKSTNEKLAELDSILHKAADNEIDMIYKFVKSIIV